LVIYRPHKGARVGAYEILEQVGHGGSGCVYKAEREGRYYAIKFLDRLAFDGWTRREVTALANLPLPNVVRFVGYDRWPDADTGHPCIITEFVSGLPLDAHVARHNPCTRWVLTLFVKITRALGDVFRLGVLHRDIKETNILVRAEDGEPILIDFGFSSVAGLPTVTTPGWLPPGTPEYRSPEALNFAKGLTEADTYTYGVSDELWALGVTLYWLLTDELPFGERTEPGLNDRIRLAAASPPRAVNPDVPEAVSRLCLRMLEKDPRARFQTHGELCGAVEALLSEHAGDVSWDVPLMEPAEDSGEEAPPAAPAPEKPQVGNPEGPPQAPRAEPAPEAPPLVGTGAPLPLGPLLLESLKRPLALVAVLALVALAVASVGTWPWPVPTRDAPPTPLAEKPAPPPDASTREGAMDEAASLREVAPSHNPAEADEGAAPVRAQPPAPPPTAMLRKPPDTTKKADDALEQPPRRSGGLSPLKKAAAASAACALLEGGCTAGTAQVRPEPAALACPAGSRETHARFELDSHSSSIVPQGYRGSIGDDLATLKEGPITVVVDDWWEKLPPGTLLTGTLTVGEKRFFGRFTQAQTPDRQTYPVCIQIRYPIQTLMRGGTVCPAGVGFCLPPGSKPDGFKAFPRFDVGPTDRFE